MNVEQRVEKLEYRVEKLEHVVNDLKEDVTELKMDVKHLSHSVSDMRVDIASIKARLDNFAANFVTHKDINKLILWIVGSALLPIVLPNILNLIKH